MKQLPFLFFFISFVAIVSFPVTGYAQTPPDGGCDPFDPACPIDGGLSLLIAAGIGLAARKSYQQHQKSLKQTNESGQ